jgi:hypothetical protein
VNGLSDSEVAVGVYAIQTAAPVFNPVAGTYAGTRSVIISSTTPGASIRYTTDGSTPTSTSGALYSGAVNISTNATLKAIAYKSGIPDSMVTSSVYNILVAAPVFSPAPGTYTNAQMVTITTATPGASIRYTTDGSAPSSSNGTLYTGPVPISSTTVLKAAAYKSGMTDNVTSGTYIFNNDPKLTGLIIGTTGSWANDPTLTRDKAFDGNVNTAFVAPGPDGNWIGLDLGAGAAIQITEVRCYPQAGWEARMNGVKLQGCNTANFSSGVVDLASINATPPLAWVELLVTNTTAFRYVRYLPPDGVWAYCDVAEIEFYGHSVSSTTVIGPVFNPWPDTWYGAQTVAITDNTPGATIRYTTNGTTPTSTSGTVYTGPVSLGASATLKAIAYKSGMTDSAVASGAYTIVSQVPAPAFSLAAGTYTGPQSVTISSADYGASIRYTLNGTTPTPTNGTLYSGAVTISANATLKAIAYHSGLTDSTVTSAGYVILTNVVAPVFSPGAGTYSGAQSVSITTTTPGANIRYTTDGTTPSSSVGTVYNSPVSIGASSTLKAMAYKAGVADSAVVSAAYVILPPVDAPVFSPPPGIYDSAQSVSITTTTPGASIRYTTDGTTPSSTNGTVYSGPIPVTNSLQLTAIAYKSGMGDSFTSGIYNIGTVLAPIWDGLLVDSIPSRDGTLQTALTNAGYAILLFGSPPTANPSTPAWWNGAATYTQVSGTRTTYDWCGIKWSGANRVPVCGEGDLRGGVAKITITPNVVTSANKKMAVILSCADNLGPTSVQITSIKVGTSTTTFNQTLTAGAGNATAGKVVLPVRPSEAIEVTLTYSNVAWSGISLAFENTNSSGTLPAAAQRADGHRDVKQPD